MDMVAHAHNVGKYIVIFQHVLRFLLKDLVDQILDASKPHN